MNRPKRAPKVCLTTKLKLARGNAIYGKTAEELSLIYGISTKRVNRAIDYVKELAGVRCIQGLTHWFHAHGMGFCNEETRQDYLKKDDDWRSAA